MLLRLVRPAMAEGTQCATAVLAACRSLSQQAPTPVRLRGVLIRTKPSVRRQSRAGQISGCRLARLPPSDCPLRRVDNNGVSFLRTTVPAYLRSSSVREARCREDDA